MAEFGFEVTNDDGRKVNLTKRTAMIMDAFLIPYNSSGSKTYYYPIGSVVCTNNNIAYHRGNKGKVINFSITDRTLSWNWVDFHEISSSDQEVLVFAGG